MENNASAPRKRHVLIVEDNVQLASSYKELLEIQGYEVSLAPDGAEALKHVLVNHTDAVICDLQMPKLEGDLFYATVERTQPSLARRFVFVTGMADDEQFQKFIATVDALVLRKPVMVTALLAEVARIMIR
jgi:response regulator RpfG family c-di-GMP phosphodiesterase